MKYNLSEAFKVRNQLKKKIETLQYQIGQVEYSVPAEDGDALTRTWPQLDGRTYDATLREINSLRIELNNLNIAIDKANDINREALAKLHNVDCEIAWASTLLNKQRAFQAKKEIYDREKEEYVTKEFNKISNFNFSEILSNFKQEKNSLESFISKNNGTTEVNFELPADISLY